MKTIEELAGGWTVKGFKPSSEEIADALATGRAEAEVSDVTPENGRMTADVLAPAGTLSDGWMTADVPAPAGTLSDGWMTADVPSQVHEILLRAIWAPSATDRSWPRPPVRQPHR